MTNENTNPTRNDNAANQAPVAVSEDGGDAMITQNDETTGPTTQPSPGSEPKAQPKPRKKGSGANGYPFRTKRAIVAQLETDGDFRHQALLILHARQTQDEQETKETKHKNARGFMSSHAVNGTNLAIKLIDGEALTDEDEAQLAGIVCRYGKQLAGHFRNEQIAKTPEVADKAAAYFVAQ